MDISSSFLRIMNFEDVYLAIAVYVGKDSVNTIDALPVQIVW